MIFGCFMQAVRAAQLSIPVFVLGSYPEGDSTGLASLQQLKHGGWHSESARSLVGGALPVLGHAGVLASAWQFNERFSDLALTSVQTIVEAAAEGVPVILLTLSPAIVEHHLPALAAALAKISHQAAVVICPVRPFDDIAPSVAWTESITAWQPRDGRIRLLRRVASPALLVRVLQSGHVSLVLGSDMHGMGLSTAAATATPFITLVCEGPSWTFTAEVCSPCGAHEETCLPVLTLISTLI